MSTLVRPWGRGTGSRIGWWLMAAGAVGLAALVVPRYLNLDAVRSPLELDPDQPTQIVWVSLHAFTAGLVLVLGPFQFLPAVRRDRPGLHRMVGRVYVGAVLAGSVTGLPAALMSTSGPVAQAGFLLLEVLWLVSICMAVRAIRAGQVQLHRVWMIRNYALTYAAVALRVLLITGMYYRSGNPDAITREQVYDIAGWGSVTLMIVIAEWIILQPTLNAAARSRRPDVPTRRHPAEDEAARI